MTELTSCSEQKQRITPVGMLLREWRAMRKPSQLDLAPEAGISTRYPSLHRIRKIAGEQPVNDATEEAQRHAGSHFHA